MQTFGFSRLADRLADRHDERGDDRLDERGDDRLDERGDDRLDTRHDNRGDDLECASLRFFRSQCRGQSVWGQRASTLGEKGQIIIEYVLLLVIVVGVAAILTRSIVNRSPDDPGFIIQVWNEILTSIGDDRADDPQLSE